MSVDLDSLKQARRLLFKIPLQPIQGSRFQPTGFPSLGAATFQTGNGATGLLVESAQSMANRLEATVWDEAAKDVKEDLQGLSHVRITRGGAFLTDTILESHRINSPYLLAGTDKTFLETLKGSLDFTETGPIDRQMFVKTLLKYDVNSLLHGVFLEKVSGRHRVARSLSAFIEADSAHVAPSGGVKNDHVNVSGNANKGFGNVPFARDEYTAASITLYVNLDLVQIRGYGLGGDVERLLILLALYKLRALTDGGMRLRTACDLSVASEQIQATQPQGWPLPPLADLTEDLKGAISTCKAQMVVVEVEYNDKLKKGKTQDEVESGATNNEEGK